MRTFRNTSVFQVKAFASGRGDTFRAEKARRKQSSWLRGVTDREV